MPNAKLHLQRLVVRERLTGPSTSRPVADAAASGPGSADGVLTAIVGHADRPTANGRIYPRREWAAAIDRANTVQCPGGMLGGSLDHPGAFDAGTFKHKAIIWRSLSMDAAGVVEGDFVIADTSAGRDLKAWIDAGGAVGFSTLGEANAREPTEAERKAFDLGVHDDVVMMEGWDLTAIDAVDNPAVSSAWMRRESTLTRMMREITMKQPSASSCRFDPGAVARVAEMVAGMRI